MLYGGRPLGGAALGAVARKPGIVGPADALAGVATVRPATVADARFVGPGSVMSGLIDVEPPVTLPLWPVDLPQRLLVDGFSEGSGDGRLRTPMDAGPGKVRRRFSAVGRTVSGQVWLDADGKSRLARFVEDEIAGGTLPFLMPAQIDDGLVLEAAGLPLTAHGRPLVVSRWWLCMLGESTPDVTALGGDNYRATLSLVVMP